LICELYSFIATLSLLLFPRRHQFFSPQNKRTGRAEALSTPRSGLLDSPLRLLRTLNFRLSAISLPFSHCAILPFCPLAVALVFPSLIWFCLGCACAIVVSVTKPTFLEVDPRRPCSSSANPPTRVIACTDESACD
jgi:hypothetical protein